MAKKKRWGKKFEDKRTWQEIDEKYILRGEYLINPRFLETWEEEIEQLNKRKVGEPFLYPDSMIEFAGYYHEKGFNYRECEGILRGLSKNYKHQFPVISFFQFYRRLNHMDFSFEVLEKEMICGVDGSGEKNISWRRMEKRKTRRNKRLDKNNDFREY